jgi:hypothetical protein
VRDKIVGVLVLLLAVSVFYWSYRMFFPPRDVIADGLPGGLTYEFDPEQFGERMVFVHPDHFANPESDAEFNFYGTTDRAAHNINTVSFQVTTYKDGRFYEDRWYYFRRTPEGMLDLRQEISSRQFTVGLTFEQRLNYLSGLHIENYAERTSWTSFSGTGPAEKLVYQGSPFDDDWEINILSHWDGEGEIVRVSREWLVVYHNIQINPELNDRLFLPAIWQ